MDETTYVALCEMHMPALHRIACSILHIRADAEDALQQTLLLAWQHRAKAHPGCEKAWMMRILINVCRSMLRKRRICVPLEDITLTAPESTDFTLREAIQALPENLRTPLLLKYMEGMSEKEVAAATGLSVTRVKSRLYRARKHLQKDLDEEVDP